MAAPPGLPSWVDPPAVSRSVHVHAALRRHYVGTIEFSNLAWGYVGSDVDCDLPFPALHASLPGRAFLIMQRRTGGVFVQAVPAVPGTLNAVPLGAGRPVRVFDASVVRVGDVDFVFQLDATARVGLGDPTDFVSRALPPRPAQKGILKPPRSGRCEQTSGASAATPGTGSGSDIGECAGRAAGSGAGGVPATPGHAGEVSFGGGASPPALARSPRKRRRAAEDACADGSGPGGCLAPPGGAVVRRRVGWRSSLEESRLFRTTDAPLATGTGDAPPLVFDSGAGPSPGEEGCPGPAACDVRGSPAVDSDDDCASLLRIMEQSVEPDAEMCRVAALGAESGALFATSLESHSVGVLSAAAAAAAAAATGSVGASSGCGLGAASVAGAAPGPDARVAASLAAAVATMPPASVRVRHAAVTTSIVLGADEEFFCDRCGTGLPPPALRFDCLVTGNEYCLCAACKGRLPHPYPLRETAHNVHWQWGERGRPAAPLGV